jgi:hypothetical protein
MHLDHVAGEGSSAPSVMTVTSSVAASGEAAFSRVNSLERSGHDESRQAQADQDRNDNWRSGPSRRRHGLLPPLATVKHRRGRLENPKNATHRELV